MTMHQPSGLQYGIPLLIDAHWSPEQAMAVIELLDDLRDRVWSRYETVLFDKFREERISRCYPQVTKPQF